MAEQPQAKKDSLGQLFVDLGVTGVGKTLKSLNSVAATFLLGKNAAMQFAQTITKPFKEAGNSAVQIGKMSNALATTTTDFQKLSMYLKKFNLSEELLGDVNKLENTLYDISQGFGNIPASMAVALQQTGLNIMKYNGSFESTMQLIDDLQKATSGMSKEKRNQILRQFGISSDWGYLWDKGGRAGDFITISEEAIKKNTELAESIEELKNSTNNLKDTLLSKIAPKLTEMANDTIEFEKDTQNKGFLYALGSSLLKDSKGALEEGKKAIEMGHPYEGGFYQNWGKLESFIGGKLVRPKKQKDLPPPPKEFPTGMAADIGYMGELPDIMNEGAGTPPNLSGMVQNITNNISHDITITGNNAQEIANRIAGISEQDIQYSQYQAANLAGL